MSFLFFLSYSKLAIQSNSRNKSVIGINRYGKNTIKITSVNIEASDINDDNFEKKGKLRMKTRKGSTSRNIKKIKRWI